MRPTIGRIVHLYEGGHGPWAAIVTDVRPGTEIVHLFVAYVSESRHVHNVPPSAPTPGFAGPIEGPYWVWPPRE